MSAYLIVPAAAVLAVTALLVAASLRLEGPAFLLGAYVAAWAEVVVLAEALSPARAIGRTGYAIGEAALLCAAAAAWQARGRFRPALPRIDRAAVARHPALTLLALVVFVAIAYEAFVAVSTPPNNVDALTYHLPRAAAWLGRGTLGYFPTETARENAFPIDAELGVLYTFVFGGRDTFAALPQLIAELAILVAVFGCSRRLGFGRPAAAFAALLTATLSELALEASTAQNDLVVASFVVVAVFFVLGRERRELPLAACALALAVGTKLTGLLALPVVAIVVATALPRRRAAELAAWSLAAFVLLGAWSYADNLAQTGHVLGVVPEDAQFVATRTPAATLSTAAHVYYRFVDFSGLPLPLDEGTMIANTGRWLFAHLRIDAPAHPSWFGFTPNVNANEDASYFGILGVLLVIPLSVAFLASGLRKRGRRSPRFALGAALPVFTLALALGVAFNPWLGRFMVVPVALTMPLAAWLYDRRLRALTAVVAGVGAVTLFYTLAYDMYAPTGLPSTGRAIWTLDRAAAQGLVAPGVTTAVRAIDDDVPQNAAVGVAFLGGQPTFPLYGPRLGRTLTLLPRANTLAAATRRSLAWVVAGPGGRLAPRPGWRVTTLDNGWQLAARSPNRGDGADRLVSARVSARPSRPATLGRIDHVADGDTVDLTNGAKIRLVQIDTPEVYFTPECYGKQASALTKRLLPPGTLVRLTVEPATDRVDRYGRLLRYVTRVRDGLDVNVYLVRVGAAAPYFYDGRRGRYAALLTRLALRARRLHLGLWGACRGTPYNPDRGVATGRPR